MIAAIETLKYDFYKGPQYYRKCDHQSVQSMIMLQSKSKELRRQERRVRYHLNRKPEREALRTCQELGHKADVIELPVALPARAGWWGSAWPV